MNDREEQDVSRLHLKLWARLLPYFRPMRGRIIFVLAMMLFSAGVDAIIPLFSGYAVNNFVVPGSTDGLWSFTAVYFLLILAQTVTTVLYSRQCMIVEMRTGKQMKTDCFLHLQKLSLSYYNTNSVGYILARVISDTNRICGIIAWGAIHFFWQFFYLLGILVSMFALNWRLALMVVLVIPVVLAVTAFFQPRLIKANRDMRHANSRITSSFNENVGGAKTSKTLAIEEKNIREFDGVTADMFKASVRSARLSAVYLPIISFAGSMAVAIVLHRSGTLVLNSALDFGVLSAFISYGIMILDPLTHLASMLSEFISAQVNIERVMALLDEPCTVSDSAEIEAEYGDVFEPKTENYPPIHGDIEFDHVWFRYPDAAEDDFVLEDISLKIPAGTTVAIVGETGAGKSTMVNLACRFFEPTRGRILIDGVDYRLRSQHWLHSNLGYVQQTPHLFSGSLKDNIRYGRPEATDEMVEQAAKLVNADSVAGKLEKGYDTDVGEGGDMLSTGEKQLVSFARAIITDPPIFVLDEATSSIDTETEHLIQNAINHVLSGRTSFIIAHRLSTIRNADIILLIEGHSIVEQGSHDELMAQKGRYYNLYTAMSIKDRSLEAGFRLSGDDE